MAKGSHWKQWVSLHIEKDTKRKTHCIKRWCQVVMSWEHVALLPKVFIIKCGLLPRFSCVVPILCFFSGTSFCTLTRQLCVLLCCVCISALHWSVLSVCVHLLIYLDFNKTLHHNYSTAYQSITFNKEALVNFLTWLMLVGWWDGSFNGMLRFLTSCWPASDTKAVKMSW